MNIEYFGRYWCKIMLVVFFVYFGVDVGYEVFIVYVIEKVFVLNWYVLGYGLFVEGEWVVFKFDVFDFDVVCVYWLQCICVQL